MEKITIRDAVSVSLEDQYIVYFEVLEGAIIDLKTACDMVSIVPKITQNPHCNFIDIRKMKFMTSEARQFLSQSTAENLIAIAILNDSFIHRHVLNIYLKFSNSFSNTRAFETWSDAHVWMKSCINKENNGPFPEFHTNNIHQAKKT